MGLNDDRLTIDTPTPRQSDGIGPRWAELTERLSHLPLTDPMRIALTLTLARLHRESHASGVFHAGCPVCTERLLAEFKGSEQDLLELFDRHVAEVRHTLSKMSNRRHTHLAA